MTLPFKLGSPTSGSGRRPSSHKRKRAREKKARDFMTEVHSTLDDERRPLPGFEEHYEITRKGDVYSKRHRRFIKPKLSVNQRPYISFTIEGQKHDLSICETVKKAFPELA